ncbi:MAG: NDP-sugar synthase [Phycisphaerales bacterium]|nr:NDP-sugar synthase [Phycisphaerales bacterium]
MNAVLFSGGPGTDICPEAWERPRPLWPVGGGYLIDYCLDALAAVGVRHAVVASNGSTGSLRAHLDHMSRPGMSIHFNEDHRPRGSAGSLADAAEHLDSDEPILLLSAACYVSRADLKEFVTASVVSGASLTVGYVADGRQDILPGVYFVKPEVLRHAKRAGYQDLKEQLIPALRRAGLRVAAIAMKAPMYPVLTKDQCLRHLGSHLTSEAARSRLTVGDYREVEPDVWVHATAEVDATARLLGPCVVGPHVKVAADAVISGPTVLESDLTVEADAVVDRSVLLAGSRAASDRGEQGALASVGVVAGRRRPSAERSDGHRAGRRGLVVAGKMTIPSAGRV